MTHDDLLSQAEAKARNITAELKNIAQDVTGLLYERTTDGKLRLRDYVATADTNTRPAMNCDDLVWATRGQSIELQELLKSLHRTHLAILCPCRIRPIPSQTVLGYEHLMADTDRGALLAEVDRLRAQRHAVLAVHHPIEAYSTFSRSVYLYCQECSDSGFDGDRGHVEWPCATAKAAGATVPVPATITVTIDGISHVFEVISSRAIAPCIDPETGGGFYDHDPEASICTRCGFASAPCEGIDRGWDGWAEDCEQEAEWLVVTGGAVKSYCCSCADNLPKVHPRPLTT